MSLTSTVYIYIRKDHNKIFRFVDVVMSQLVETDLFYFFLAETSLLNATLSLYFTSRFAVKC